MNCLVKFTGTCYARHNTPPRFIYTGLWHPPQRQENQMVISAHRMSSLSLSLSISLSLMLSMHAARGLHHGLHEILTPSSGILARFILETFTTWDWAEAASLEHIRSPTQQATECPLYGAACSGPAAWVAQQGH